MPSGLLIAWALVSALAVDAPRVSWGGADADAAASPSLWVHDLPTSLLADDTVRAHWTSGLTTGVVLRATTKGRGALSGGARIDIRFEPWDEVFLVTAIGIDSRGDHARLPSFEALEAWWQALRLVVVVDPALASSRPSDLRLELDVVPFSEQEQRDTQRWFTDVLNGDGAARDVGATTGEGSDGLRQVFHVLMATSIRPRPLASFRWTVPLTPAEVAP